MIKLALERIVLTDKRRLVAMPWRVKGVATRCIAFETGGNPVLAFWQGAFRAGLWMADFLSCDPCTPVQCIFFALEIRPLGAGVDGRCTDLHHPLLPFALSHICHKLPAARVTGTGECSTLNAALSRASAPLAKKL